MPSGIFRRERKRQITDLSFDELAEQLATGAFSARETTEASLYRAAVVRQLVNCLTDFMMPSALATADRLDARVREHGTTIGPLHGVPVSIKDHIFVEEYETAAGMVAWLDKKTTADQQGIAVRALRARRPPREDKCTDGPWKNQDTDVRTH
ncbi:amidase [Malassezia sp. CBS 17886]|nr:amidase [Malassezia sp. CBS 17886]